jgi:hypothetical protein
MKQVRRSALQSGFSLDKPARGATMLIANRGELDGAASEAIETTSSAANYRDLLDRTATIVGRRLT